MTFIARWQTAQEQVTIITSTREINRLLGSAPANAADTPAEIHVFAARGSSCIALAADTELHQRVARAALLQHAGRTMAAACGTASSSAR